MPESLHSDRGKQFDCDVMQEMCKLLGIRKTFTPAYNPKSNTVERAHRDMKACKTTSRKVQMQKMGKPDVSRITNIRKTEEYIKSRQR